MPAALHQFDDLPQQIDTEHARAQSLHEHNRFQVMLLEDCELITQTALAPIGDAVDIAVQRKAPAIAPPVGSVGSNFGIDGDNHRGPTRLIGCL